MEKRFSFIDVAKGISIVLIVLGHLLKNNIIITWIYSFHVPIFFIITGYLLKTKSSLKLNKVVKIRFKSIMIPYLIFSIFLIIYDFISNSFSIDILKWDILYTIFLVSPSALWFLPATYIAEILFVLNNNIKNKYVSLIFILFAFIVAKIISMSNYNIILLFTARVLIGFGFISIGYYSYKLINNLNFKIGMLMLLISFIISQLNVEVDLYSLKIGNLFIYLFNGIFGSLATIEISKKLCNITCLKFWGINSIIIMGTHQWMTREFVKNFSNDFNFITLLGLLIIMTLEYPIIKFINKYGFWMLGKNRTQKVVKQLPA